MKTAGNMLIFATGILMGVMYNKYENDISKTVKKTVKKIDDLK